MRIPARLGLPVALLAATSLLAGGCEHTEPYTKATACGVEAGLVEAVMGTDRFTVEENGPLGPLGAQSAHYICSIYLGDTNAFAIQARLDSMGGAGRMRAAITDYQVQFDYAGGQAGVDKRSAGWACGESTWITMTPMNDKDLDPSTKALKSLLEAVVDRVGCGPTASG